MKNKDLIGRKVKGFSFESHPNEYKLQYTVWMDGYIEKTGVIKSYDLFLDAYQVIFNLDTDEEQSFHYPSSEIEKHLVGDVITVTVGDYRTFEQRKEDQDLLDKFALQALPAVIERVSINLTHEAIAQHAYGIARAMMKERSNNGN